MSIPLYQAGLVYSQVREAKQIASQNRIQVIEVARAVRQTVALGAKLSGGGRGGNMIALVQKEKAESVSTALLSAGAKRTIVNEVS